MVNLTYIKKRTARRIILAVAGGCAAVALVIGAIALLGQRASPLTVTLTNSGAKLTLSQTSKPEGSDNRVYLVADKVPSYCEYTEDQFNYYSKELDDENTYSEFAEKESATLFFKYTFFVNNNGSAEADYDLTLTIDNPTKNASNRYDLDSILRVRFYENKNLDEHNYVTYAKKSADPHIDENGEQSWKEQIAGDGTGYAEEFVSNKVILKSAIRNLAPGEKVRNTFVFWLEGEDPQCQGEAPVNSALVLGVSVDAHEAENPTNK